jgi:hypothetical protein
MRTELCQQCALILRIPIYESADSVATDCALHCKPPVATKKAVCSLVDRQPIDTEQAKFEDEDYPMSISFDFSGARSHQTARGRVGHRHRSHTSHCSGSRNPAHARVRGCGHDDGLGSYSGSLKAQDGVFTEVRCSSRWARPPEFDLASHIIL